MKHFLLFKNKILINTRIYISRYLPYVNRDVKLSVLSLGHFISFRFATQEVKDVN